MLVFDTYEDEGRGKKGRSWMLEVDRVEVGRLKSWVGWKLGSWEDGKFGKFESCEVGKLEVERLVICELEVGKG